jgi:hypothetical protein
VGRKVRLTGSVMQEDLSCSLQTFLPHLVPPHPPAPRVHFSWHGGEVSGWNSKAFITGVCPELPMKMTVETLGDRITKAFRKAQHHLSVQKRPQNQELWWWRRWEQKFADNEWVSSVSRCHQWPLCLFYEEIFYLFVYFLYMYVCICCGAEDQTRSLCMLSKHS